MCRLFLFSSILLLLLPLHAGKQEIQEPVRISHSIDGFITHQSKIPWPITDDETFLRKVWLDLTGTIPSEAVIESWWARPKPWDRVAIVEEALASPGYVSRWTYFLEELLQVYMKAGGSHIARLHFHNNLRRKIEDNRSWDGIIRDIFYWQGNILNEHSYYMFWDNTLNGPLTWLDGLDDRTAFLSEKLLGLRTECISCHDGAYHLEKVNVGLSKMKRSEFWQLAAFLASAAPFCKSGCGEEDLILDNAFFYDFDSEIERDVQFAKVPGLGSLTPGYYHAQSPPGEGMRPPRDGGQVLPEYPWTGERPRPNERAREALGRILTSDRQFARNMVNRVWKHFFGRGFVDPVNAFDLARLNAEVAEANGTTVQPIAPELMEYVTDAFIESGHDFKALFRLITSSSLYQLDLDALPDGADDWEGPYFGGRLRFRPLEAEAILTSLAEINGRSLVYRTLQLGDGIVENPWDLPDTTEPIFSPEAMTLLNALGRSDREMKREVRTELNQTASLALMNNRTLLRHLRISDWVAEMRANMEAGTRTTAQIASEIYQRVQVKTPTAEELERAVFILESDREDPLIDFIWSQINHMDFLFR